MPRLSPKINSFYVPLFLVFFLTGIVLCVITANLIIRWLPIRQPREQTIALEPTATSVTKSKLPTPGKMTSEERSAPIYEDIGRAYQLLEILNSNSIPSRDPVENAVRLKGISETSINKRLVPVSMTIGDRKNFWVLNINDNTYKQTSARLVSQTAHLNFWIEEEVPYDIEHVKALADVFENQIYPTNREIFGGEWSPGVDGDDRLIILYAQGLGGAAGYYSAKDALSNQIDMFSNEAEMFYLSADYMRLDDEITYGVLAHEFQHMIHWNIDRNESAWINEGLSELAVELNGFPASGFDWMFSTNPDIPLTFWPGADQGDSRPHYGASYLFMKYFLNRFGINAIQKLTAHPENGLTSIDAVLSNDHSEQAADRGPMNAESLFQDWTIANILRDENFDGGVYAYGSESYIPQFAITEQITCGSGWQELTVHQFGADYLIVDCDQPYVIEIKGEDTVALLPIDPLSGNYYFWSNYGDESSMKLSRRVDFSEVNADIAMEYWTWFDIERDYDYAYLLASVNGQDWEILEPSACTLENPTGGNYGCGYSGKSQGWIQQHVDLGQFAGQEVIIMFEYLTDGAVNGDGLLLDDISIEKIGYFADFERDDGGWKAEGFVRISNSLPQAYALTFIDQEPLPKVQKIISSQNLTIAHMVNQINEQIRPLVVISGLTRHTRIPAVYTVRAEMIP